MRNPQFYVFSKKPMLIKVLPGAIPYTKVTRDFVIELSYNNMAATQTKHLRAFALSTAWRSNHIDYKLWDEIIYPFPNYSGCTVEV